MPAWMLNNTPKDILPTYIEKYNNFMDLDFASKNKNVSTHTLSNNSNTNNSNNKRY